MPRGSGWVTLRAVSFTCLVVALAPPARAQDHKDKSKKHQAAGKKKADHREAPPENVPTTVETKHAVAPEPAPADAATMQTRGPTRLDFDDRVVQGQGSKVGAVYLYDRKSLPLRSMVRKRENFRDQISSDEVSGPVVE
jgi:hypothetical protein